MSVVQLQLANPRTLSEHSHRDLANACLLKFLNLREGVQQSDQTQRPERARVGRLSASGEEQQNNNNNNNTTSCIASCRSMSEAKLSFVPQACLQIDLAVGSPGATWLAGPL